jgi:hypothetical protein
MRRGRGCQEALFAEHGACPEYSTGLNGGPDVEAQRSREVMFDKKVVKPWFRVSG